jgi:hypothetical protein
VVAGELLDLWVVRRMQELCHSEKDVILSESEESRRGNQLHERFFGLWPQNDKPAKLDGSLVKEEKDAKNVQSRLGRSGAWSPGTERFVVGYGVEW